jgi:diguanylate cyclase (GGDEF)-like protein
MIKLVKLLFVFLVYLSVCPLVKASEPDLRFEHLNLEHGLPQSTVFTIHQDKQGFMWFGTQDGLARFDGYDFKVFKHSTKDSTSISNNSIRAIAEDKAGFLWIGTFGGGLNRFDPKKEQFIRFNSSSKTETKLSHDYISSIVVSEKGNLWIGTMGGGVNHFNVKAAEFKHYKFNINNLNSLSNDDVRGIEEDKQGNIWIGTFGGGLNRFNPNKSKFTYFRTNENDINSLSDDRVSTIKIDKRGDIWIGTEVGLNRFNFKKRIFNRYFHDENNNNSLSDNRIWSITEDHKNNIWIGANGTNGGGLNKLNVNTGHFSRYTSKPNEPSSLSRNKIWSLFEDKDNNMWVGTAVGGLNRVNLKKAFFNLHHYQSNNANSLNNNEVYAIAGNGDGNVYIGTDGGGVNYFDTKLGLFTHYTQDNNDINSLSDNNVRAIELDKKGNVWIGTGGGGLNYFDPITAKFKHFRAKQGDSTTINNDKVTAIAETDDGKVWFGTFGGGINIFNPENDQFKFYKFDESQKSSLSSNFINVIIQDENLNIWIGTRGGGLNLYNVNSQSFQRFQHDFNDPNSLSNNDVRDIFEDSEGNLWVGTTIGLNLFEKNTGQFKSFNVNNGLRNDYIYRIEEDNNRNLWLSTNHGISQFKLNTLSFKNFDVTDGLQSNEFNTGASFKSHNGEIYFGGINGINSFYPENFAEDASMPSVVLTDVLLFNKSVALTSIEKNQPPQEALTLDTSINYLDGITLTHKENVITFEFSALHFTNPKKNRFSYKLVGFDEDWNSTSFDKRRATYTNLNSGDYVFNVRASNADSVWNMAGTSIRVTVLPPAWKTWWAYTIYVLIGVVIIWGFIWTQRKKVLLERQLSNQLEATVAERTEQLQKAYSQLEEVSLTDQLTGLKNRRFLMKNLQIDIAQCKRKYENWLNIKNAEKPEDNDLIFYLIDIDNFKLVNDTYEHAAGDKVLIQIKDILNQVYRESDYLVRWGGEEFLVIVRFTDRDVAAEIAERLRETVENFDFDIGEDKFIKQTCSIGFASYPFVFNKPDCIKWERVVDIADHCLYAAKKSGRNTWVGLNSTENCRVDSLDEEVIGKTASLIQANELAFKSSISNLEKLNW